MGKDVGQWTTFGGGGCVLNNGADARDFCLLAWAVSYRVQDKMRLSKDKTRITNARNGQAKFLGTLISIGKGREQKVVTTTNGSRKPVKRRSTGWETVLAAPLDSLIQRLHSRGFCTPNGTSQTKLGWINLDADQIVHLYNGMNRGILNYYRFVDNINTLTRIQHILRFSLARTLAAKFKISVKRVFQRFGSSITVSSSTDMRLE